MSNVKLHITSTEMPDSRVPDQPPPPLPISKLRGVPSVLRVRLKRRGITNCDQLLAAAGQIGSRRALADRARVELASLYSLVKRADLARVNGIGVVFGEMLEYCGVQDVAALANESAEHLHVRVRRFNESERMARRSPTLEEVEDWVMQARALPRQLLD